MINSHFKKLKIVKYLTQIDKFFACLTRVDKKTNCGHSFTPNLILIAVYHRERIPLTNNEKKTTVH